MKKEERAANKPQRGEKSQAIRSMISSHPSAGNKKIAELLVAQGIKCTAQDVANQKARLKRAGMLASAAAVTLEEVLRIKEIVTQSGGIKAVKTILANLENIAEQVGGVAKLKSGIEALEQIQT